MALPSPFARRPLQSARTPDHFSTGRASSRSMFRLLWEPNILCYTYRQNTQAQRTTVLFSSPRRYSTCFPLAAGEIGALPAFAVLSVDDAYGNGSCGCRIITPYSGRLTQRGRHVQLLLVVFTGYGGASVWDHFRSLGHIVGTSAMFLEEVQHNSRGLLHPSQFFYPDQGASGGDERAAATCRQ
jgi:hypothetical protein